MGYETQADDWEVQGICQIGAGAVGAAGIFLFQFYSGTADYEAFFVFAGAGFGLGGSLGGAGIPMSSIIRQLEGARRDAITDHEDNYTELECENPFSAGDLNRAMGRLSVTQAGLAVGYGYVYVSAGSWPSKTLFLSQKISGWGTGVGASMASFVGMWKYLQ